MHPDFRNGVRAALPLLLGVVPFALVSGVAAVGAGLTLVEAMGLSVVVFAGASQLAVLELLGQNAPLAVVILTAAVINVRMVMYSASIAPYFRPLRRRWKVLLAYLLTDQAYALSIAEYARTDDTDRRWYYFGIAVTIWVVWQLATVAGIALGANVPDRWGLQFAVPLVFLTLLVMALKDRETVAAGVVGGGVAVAGAGLPLNLGLVVGALAGVATGVLVERRADR
ncbi:AzlC family ABC transporter permease [Haloplanus sp. GCM10025708]|uniref:AzlC family ABC transporter permease n=1 Tax=Haloferacaceae TaxID=1644056 RepID=UPI00361A08D0